MVDPLKIPGLGRAKLEADALQMRKPAVHKPQADAPSFKDVLTDAVSEVQRLQDQADTTIKQLVAGEITDVTQAMVAIEKADVAFQTMMTVRGKVMSAYEEIMRMQL